MAIEASSNQAERFGIVVDGGPAPGLNGTINTMTLEAGNRGREAVGIYCQKGSEALRSFGQRADLSVGAPQFCR